MQRRAVRTKFNTTSLGVSTDIERGEVVLRVDGTVVRLTPEDANDLRMALYDAVEEFLL